MELQLKQLLEEKGMTQQDLANILGVTRQYISNTARGGSASIDFYERIADTLEVPLWHLFAPAEVRQAARTVTESTPDLILKNPITNEETRYIKLP